MDRYSSLTITKKPGPENGLCIMSSNKKSTGINLLYAVIAVLCIIVVIHNVFLHKQTVGKADELRKAPANTFVMTEGDDIVKIIRFSEEKDEITTISPDSILHVGPVLDLARQTDEIVPPKHQNYGGYEHLCQELTMQAVFTKSGPRSAILMDNGSVIILDEPKIQNGLVKVSKSFGTTQLVPVDDITAHAVRIVSARRHEDAAGTYDKLVGCYTSDTKLPILQR